jgi:hypothetical protein
VLEIVTSGKTPETFTKSKVHQFGSVPGNPSVLLKQELYNRIQADPSIFVCPGEGIWYYDMETKGMLHCPEFKELFGYAEYEVPNLLTWWQKHMFPNHVASAMTFIGEHMTDGKPFDQLC